MSTFGSGVWVFAVSIQVGRMSNVVFLLLGSLIVDEHIGATSTKVHHE